MIPTLSTERLTLRGPRMADFDAYAAFRGSERARFVGGPHTRPEAWSSFAGIAGHWYLRGYGRWIVALAATDAAIGVVGLFHPDSWPEPEIAWSMFGSAEGRGLAFEAATEARRYAYEVAGLTTAISFVDPANARSVALARRLGCRPDGTHAHPDFGTMHIQRHPGPAEIAP